MYIGGWLTLVVLSLSVSLAAFLWGLKSGQFSDQEKARFLPLGKDLMTQPVVGASRRKQKLQSAMLLVIVILVLTAFGIALSMSLYYR